MSGPYEAGRPVGGPMPHRFPDRHTTGDATHPTAAISTGTQTAEPLSLGSYWHIESEDIRYEDIPEDLRATGKVVRDVAYGPWRAAP